ncbi:hypothetical protein SAMN02799624_04232 [Paenibacillus sp. UNC496MF]|nr:hypothetical protein SAMN02799624_04232 [Paenibacillus sp. UNC496MF]
MMKRRLVLLAAGLMLFMLVLPVQANAASKQLLYQFDGAISDFDQTRIVWKATGNKVLWLYNRTNKSEAKVYDAAGTDAVVSQAKLTAEGVVYTFTDPKSRKAVTEYWKDGEARQLADASFTAIKGNYALFADRVVDIATGQSRPLGPSDTDVSPDGAIVYSTIGDLYEQLPGGTPTKLASRSPSLVSQWYHANLGLYQPVTDGTNIVFRELMLIDNYRYLKWVTRLIGPDGKRTTLAINPWPAAVDYDVNNGWIAYTKYEKDKDSWILYVRSPEGVDKPVFAATWWSPTDLPLSIDKTWPDGSVTYTYNRHTYIYFKQADKIIEVTGVWSQFQYREHVFGGPNETQYRYGVWYRLAGGSLFESRV